MRAALIATFLATSLAASLAEGAGTRVATAESPATPEASTSTHDSPLIAYAVELNQSQSHTQDKALYIATTNLRAATFELSRSSPPSDEECAHTLGASRFAEQYAHLATIHDQLGDFEAVIAANESALACQPRVASYQASIASAHLILGHIEEARAAAERAYAMDPEDQIARDVRARLDFIQERWADATARLRLQVLDERYAGSVLRDYARCYLWLAQRRAGVHNPDVPPIPQGQAKEEDVTPARQWPTQILDTLRGDLSEEALVQVIRTSGENEARERLTEALFYVGELRLAEGDAERARRHFASVVNLRVLNFVEYGMARAELRKMRASAEGSAQAR
jgi:lipoprotein NlpI